MSAALLCLTAFLFCFVLFLSNLSAFRSLFPSTSFRLNQIISIIGMIFYLRAIGAV